MKMFFHNYSKPLMKPFTYTFTLNSSTNRTITLPLLDLETQLISNLRKRYETAKRNIIERCLKPFDPLDFWTIIEKNKSEIEMIREEYRKLNLELEL